MSLIDSIEQLRLKLRVADGYDDQGLELFIPKWKSKVLEIALNFYESLPSGWGLYGTCFIQCMSSSSTSIRTCSFSFFLSGAI